jgi:hypothetical protein
MKLVAATAAMAAAALFDPSADAQDASSQDWEVVRTDAAVAAATQYDNGLMLAVRCVGGQSLNAMIVGLPSATGYTRQLATWFEGGERDAEYAARPGLRDPQGWGVGANAAVAFSRYPAGLARRLREGGTMNVVVPGGAQDGRNLRYVLALPDSPAAIESVLNACGRELQDPRDAELETLGDSGLPHEIEWVRQPRIQYPSGRTFIRGFVTVSCMTTAQGRTDDCVVESEQPEGGGFADAVLAAARDGRLRNKLAPSDPVPRVRIMYQARFVMEDEGADSGVRSIRGRMRGR